MTNRNEDDIALHSQHADRWWQPDGPAAPLHQLNPLRLDLVRKHLCTDDHLLDVGCGAGIFTESVRPHCASATGIDASQAMIDAAQKHAKGQGLDITYHGCTAEEFAAQNQTTYQVITCFELLEHVPKPESVLNACVSMLAPNGFLVLSTLNRTPSSFLKAIVAGEYLTSLIPPGTHRYRDFIKPSEIDACLGPAGLVFIEQSGIDYSLTHRRFELIDDCNANYLLIYRRIPVK